MSVVCVIFVWGVHVCLCMLYVTGMWCVYVWFACGVCMCVLCDGCAVCGVCV